ncbi:MAG: hypothetical protein LBS50_00230 [Prevotellaceae bacterium]|jgi:hypothetical protein|nr:hypothetical protein [Prevotellaceae bacterium]
MKRFLFSIAVILLAINGLNAQKFKPVPDFLKGETQINVIFDYSKTTFDGDSQKEQYKDKGKKWVGEWEGKRRDGNANAFISSVNDELTKVDANVGEHNDAKYTLIVEVLDCDFGAYAGPMSVPAKIKATVRVVKTGTTEILASITLKESQNPYTVVGTPVDFDRMYLAFGELGEEVGEKLVKVLK